MLNRSGRENLQIEVYVTAFEAYTKTAVSQRKVDTYVLYYRIETQLRAFETLSITSDKCSAMLIPLIESCLPESLLRV